MADVILVIDIVFVAGVILVIDIVVAHVIFVVDLVLEVDVIFVVDEILMAAFCLPFGVMTCGTNINHSILSTTSILSSHKR